MISYMYLKESGDSMIKVRQWFNDNIMKKEYKMYEVSIKRNFKFPSTSYVFSIEEEARSKQEAITQVKEFIRKNANPGDNYEVVKAKRVK